MRCVLVALAGLLTAANAARPNILFVLVDDLGWNDLSFHGSTQIPTPHIDSIAQAGQALDRFYVGEFAYSHRLLDFRRLTLILAFCAIVRPQA